MARKKTNPDFLNGVPELLVLRLLSRQAMYGYQLVQAIKVTSGEQLEFGEGSIYPVLHRLEAEGCLSSQEETVNGRARYIYRATKKGEQRLAESLTTWERIASAIQSVMASDRIAATR